MSVDGRKSRPGRAHVNDVPDVATCEEGKAIDARQRLVAFETSLSAEPEEAVVTVSGEVDLSTADSLTAELEAAVSLDHQRPVVVDLAE